MRPRWNFELDSSFNKTNSGLQNDIETVEFGSLLLWGRIKSLIRPWVAWRTWVKVLIIKIKKMITERFELTPHRE